MHKREKWIDEVLNSMDSMKQAVPDDAVFANILNRLPAKKVRKLIPIHTVSSVAAGLALLLTANIFLLSNESQAIAQNDAGVEEVVEYYQLNETSNPYMQ